MSHSSALCLAIASAILIHFISWIQENYIILIILLGITWRGSEFGAAIMVVRTVVENLQKPQAAHKKIKLALKIWLILMSILLLASYGLSVTFGSMSYRRLKGEKVPGDFKKYLYDSRKATFGYEVAILLFAIGISGLFFFYLRNKGIPKVCLWLEKSTFEL